MAGTRTGGLKARDKNKQLYGEDYYAKIGKAGGARGTTGGFYYSMVNGKTTHIEAGRKGGTISRRSKDKEK